MKTRVGSVLLVLASVVGGPSPAARAAGSCTPTGAHLDVVLTSEAATLDVDGAGDIRLNGSTCGANVSSTDDIDVTGASGSVEKLVVDLALPFTPGATPEGSGVSEIEIDVVFEGDPGDAVVVQGGDGPDALVAGAGGIDLTHDDDLDLSVTGASTRIEGGGGNDLLRADGGGVHGSSAGDVPLSGGPGDDTLVGGSGDDALVGGDGDDLLEASAGNDRIGGGPGADTVSYALAPFGVQASFAKRSATGWGNHVLLELEHIVGSPNNDRLQGSEESNRIEGLGGLDRISGSAGDDLLIGGAGRDFFRAGSGRDVVLGGRGGDTYTLRAAPRGVEIDLRRGTARGDGRDRLTSIEKAVGSRFDDTIRGSNGNNHRLVGSLGDDVIVGRGGDDRIRGGPGDDVLQGGPGDDDLDGGPGDDMLQGGPGDDRLGGSPGNDIRRQ